MRTGRPSSFNEQIAAQCIARIAGGLSVERTCRGTGMPNKTTFYRWVGEREDFRNAYARALESRGIHYADKAVDIAERCIGGSIAPDRARVAADIYKWAAARMAPKMFGDKLNVEHAGSVTHEIADARRSVQGKLDRLVARGGEESIPRVTH